MMRLGHTVKMAQLLKINVQMSSVYVDDFTNFICSILCFYMNTYNIYILYIYMFYKCRFYMLTFFY